MFCLYVLFHSAKFVADRCAIIRCSHWSVSASLDCNVTYSMRRTKGEHVLALSQRQAKIMREKLTGLAISRLAVATPDDGTKGPPTIFAALSCRAFNIAPASTEILGEVRYKSLNATPAHVQRLQFAVGGDAP